MLIDCHAHAFADKIAVKAVQQLIDYYQMPTTNGGCLSDLINAANQAKLDAFILLVAATKPEQVKPANDWVLEIASQPQAILGQLGDPKKLPRIIPFGTYHVADPNWLTEVNRLRTAGTKGIKLHPEFQGIDLADPRLGPFFEEISGHFVLMVHVGDPKVDPHNFSTPRKIATILKKFPKLKIIAAHLGGWDMWDQVAEYLVGLPLFLDTSLSVSYLGRTRVRDLIRAHGPHRVLFGTDSPWAPQLSSLGQVRALGLDAQELEAILCGNAEKILAR